MGFSDPQPRKNHPMRRLPKTPTMKAPTLKTVALAAMMALTGAGARAEVPRVVADIPAVQSLVAMVMGDLGAPLLLLDQGADPHRYQLRPSQAAALVEADLVVWIGPEMTPWLDRALTLAESAGVLGLLADPGTLRRHFAAGDDDPAGTDGDGHDHDHEGTDPHGWLDPGNARHWLDLIAAALAARDPDHATAFRVNADHAQAEIASLDARLRDRLAAAGGAPIAVAHDAYGYFAAHYRLTIAAHVAAGDAADPGAARLAEVKAILDAGQVRCLFPEVGRNPGLIDALIADTGVRVGRPLDPAGIALEPGPGLYLALIDTLGTTIAECLDGV